MTIYESKNLNTLWSIFSFFSDDPVNSFMSGNSYVDVKDITKYNEKLTKILDVQQTRITSMNLPSNIRVCLSVLQAYANLYDEDTTISNLAIRILTEYFQNRMQPLNLGGVRYNFFEVNDNIAKIAESFDSNLIGLTYQDVLTKAHKVIHDICCFYHDYEVYFDNSEIPATYFYNAYLKDELDQSTKVSFDTRYINKVYDKIVRDLEISKFFDGSYISESEILRDLQSEYSTDFEELENLATDCYCYFEFFDKKYKQFLSEFAKSGLDEILSNYLTVLYPIRSLDDFLNYVNQYSSFILQDTVNRDFISNSSSTELTAVEQAYIECNVFESGNYPVMKELEIAKDTLSNEYTIQHAFPESFSFTNFVRMRNMLSITGFGALKFFKSICTLYDQPVNGVDCDSAVFKYIKEFASILDCETQYSICKTTSDYCVDLCSEVNNFKIITADNYTKIKKSELSKTNTIKYYNLLKFDSEFIDALRN
jgi:hypothetical protein